MSNNTNTDTIVYLQSPNGAITQIIDEKIINRLIENNWQVISQVEFEELKAQRELREDFEKARKDLKEITNPEVKFF